VFPDRILRARSAPIVGGSAAPEATLPTPPLSWAPDFPDRTPRPRAAPLVGGMAGPDATIPNPPAPSLSWAPVFADAVPRAPAALIVGGATAPEATLPNAAPAPIPPAWEKRVTVTARQNAPIVRARRRR